MPSAIPTPAPCDDVLLCQRRLCQLGYEPGALDGIAGPATRAALLRLQSARGLASTGICDAATDATLAALMPLEDVLKSVDAGFVARLFPATPRASIVANLPPIRDALRRFGLVDRAMVAMTLATIVVECGTLAPLDERPCAANTSQGGRAFDRYDDRRDLGNRGAPDGARYHGRGFVQLTGRANYARFGRMIGQGLALERAPERASEPATAALLLAAFLRAGEAAIRQALGQGDLAAARRVVNGGTNGLERFTAAWRQADRGLGALDATMLAT